MCFDGCLWPSKGIWIPLFGGTALSWTRFMKTISIPGAPLTNIFCLTLGPLNMIPLEKFTMFSPFDPQLYQRFICMSFATLIYICRNSTKYHEYCQFSNNIVILGFIILVRTNNDILNAQQISSRFLAFPGLGFSVIKNKQSWNGFSSLCVLHTWIHVKRFKLKECLSNFNT